MFYGIGIISLIYVEDLLLFVSNQDNIDAFIKETEDADILLTVEEDVYDFFGVEVKTYNQSGKVTLTQGGLTQKLLKTLGMLYIKKKITLAGTIPLGTYAGGIPFDEPWGYASVVVIFMYLSSNSRPDIQFAVHHCVRFTHNTSSSHDESVNMICHYLVV